MESPKSWKDGWKVSRSDWRDTSEKAKEGWRLSSDVRDGWKLPRKKQ